MKKQVILIHSAGPQGRDEGSTALFHYMQRTLGSRYDVLCPPMPEPENPRYHLWKTKLEKELAMAENGLLLVGHSLGGSVLLKYLSEEPFYKLIRGMFLVAAPFWGKKNWEMDEFVLQKDFASRLPQVSNMFLYHSRRDKWVPFSHMQHYAAIFPGAKARAIDGDEHEFSAGLPELIQDIKSLSRHGGSI